MMTTHRIRTSFVVVLVIFLGSATLVSGLFVMVKREEKGLRRATDALQELLEDEVFRASSLGEDDMASLEDDLRRRFVKADDVVSVIEDLENLGSLASVTITIVSVDLTENSPEKTLSVAEKNLVMRFTAEGTWGRVVHALHFLEAMPYALLIESARLERSLSETKTVWRGTFDVILPVDE